VLPILVDADGRELEGATDRVLCLADRWPGQARTLWGNHDRFFRTYF